MHILLAIAIWLLLNALLAIALTPAHGSRRQRELQASLKGHHDQD